jgi:hypothetical protein
MLRSLLVFPRVLQFESTSHSFLELTKPKLDLVGVQEGSWEKGERDLTNNSTLTAKGLLV